MENLLYYTLFGNAIVFAIVVVVFFIALILSDQEESGWIATILFIIFFGSIHFWSTFPITSYVTFKNVGMYLFIGFIYSIVRTYFKGKELNEKEKERFDLRDHIFRWWLLFPICAVNWVFGRLLADLFNWVYRYINKLYYCVFNA